MKRKIFIISLVLSVVLVFSACENDTPNESLSTVTTGETSSIVSENSSDTDKPLVSFAPSKSENVVSQPLQKA